MVRGLWITYGLLYAISIGLGVLAVKSFYSQSIPLQSMKRLQRVSREFRIRYVDWGVHAGRSVPQLI